MSPELGEYYQTVSAEAIACFDCDGLILAGETVHMFERNPLCAPCHAKALRELADYVAFGEDAKTADLPEPPQYHGVAMWARYDHDTLGEDNIPWTVLHTDPTMATWEALDRMWDRFMMENNITLPIPQEQDPLAEQFSIFLETQGYVVPSMTCGWCLPLDQSEYETPDEEDEDDDGGE